MPKLWYGVGVMAVWAITCVASTYAQTSPDASRFDNGKMWTFEYAPVEYFEETYDFDVDDTWFENARWLHCAFLAVLPLLCLPTA